LVKILQGEQEFPDFPAVREWEADAPEKAAGLKVADGPLAHPQIGGGAV
jgi:hypothetical protein